MSIQPTAGQESGIRLDDLFADAELSHYSAVNACVNSCRRPSESGMGDALMYPVPTVDPSN